MKRLLLIAALAVAPVAAAAEGTPRNDVQELYGYCKETGGSQRLTYCLGYIAGIGQLMRQMGHNQEMHQYGLCSDQGISTGAMVQAFRNWAEQNPRSWNVDAVLGVGAALATAWPCK
jgi:hypothetical protein